VDRGTLLFLLVEHPLTLQVKAHLLVFSVISHRLLLSFLLLLPTFYGIVQDGPKDAEDFARRYSLTFPQLLDYPDYKVSESYLVEVVPTIYLVNEEKLIEFVSSSFVKKDLENLIRKLSLVAQRPEQDIFEGTQVPVFKPG